MNWTFHSNYSDTLLELKIEFHFEIYLQCPKSMTSNHHLNYMSGEKTIWYQKGKKKGHALLDAHK